jgi:hypothetical protein
MHQQTTVETIRATMPELSMNMATAFAILAKAAVVANLQKDANSIPPNNSRVP